MPPKCLNALYWCQIFDLEAAVEEDEEEEEEEKEAYLPRHRFVKAQERLIVWMLPG